MSRWAMGPGRHFPAGLLLAAIGLAVAVSACSPPRSGTPGLGGASIATNGAFAGGALPSRDAAGGDRAVGARAEPTSAPAASPASIPASVGPALASTRRDERTLAAATPYEDRHGKSACKEDCVHHEAGYKWAALHTVTEEARCAGATPGFVDGGRAYAADHQRGPPAGGGGRG